MTIAETERDPPYAKIPHALILVHPAPHVRLYGVLHYLAWNHLTFEVGDLARMMGDTPDRAVAERTIYRWLDALAEAGWIAYDRKPGRRGLGERITLYTSPNGRAQTSDPQIRGLPKPLTPGSEVCETSDPQIRGLSKPLTPGSEVCETSDPQIRGTPNLPRPNAAKNAPQISGFRSPDSDPTIHHPHTPSAAGGGGGGGGGELSIVIPKPAASGRTPAPFAPTPGARLLAAEGFRAPGIREFGHYPPEVLSADIARMRGEGTEPGGMVLHWRQFPPGTTPTSEAPHATNRPRRLPTGASPTSQAAGYVSQPAPPGSPRAPKPHELEERFRRLEAEHAAAERDAPR